MKTQFDKLTDLMDWSVKTLEALKYDFDLRQTSKDTFDFMAAKDGLTIFFSNIKCNLNHETWTDFQECYSGSREYYTDETISPEVKVSSFCDFEAFDEDGETVEYNPTIAELEFFRNKFLEYVELDYECGNLKF